MYRANIKPWRSADWKPHLLDHVHDHEKGVQEVLDNSTNDEKSSA